MQPGKRHHVHGQFSQVCVELAWKAEAGGNAAHRGRDEMVKVAVGGRCELQRAEADVVQGLVIDAVSLVRVLHQLVDGEGGVVWFHHRVGHLKKEKAPLRAGRAPHS